MGCSSQSMIRIIMHTLYSAAFPHPYPFSCNPMPHLKSTERAPWPDTSNGSSASGKP